MWVRHVGLQLFLKCHWQSYIMSFLTSPYKERGLSGAAALLLEVLLLDLQPEANISSSSMRAGFSICPQNSNIISHTRRPPFSLLFQLSPHE